MKAYALNRAILILGFIGLFIAGTLSLAHLMGVIPPCGAAAGCEKVQTHSSSIWNLGFVKLPVAYVGLGGYVAIVALAILRQRKVMADARPLVNAGFAMTAIGMAISLFLTFYSITSIHATCAWCIGSAVVMTILFLLHMALAQMDLPTEANPTTSMDFKVLAAAGLACVMGLGIMGTRFYVQLREAPKTSDKYKELPPDSFVPETAHFQGHKNARVTVVEFGDLVCPSCRAVYKPTHEELDRYQGRVKFVFRHMPMHNLQGHEAAVPAAVLAEIAAEQGKFWEFMSAAYAIEEEPKDIGPFLAVAKNVGVNVSGFDARATDSNDKAFSKVYNDLAFADKIGIAGTPSFVVLIDGKKPEAVSAAGLLDILRSKPVQDIISAQ